MSYFVHNNSSIKSDALTALNLGKNLLLKGPTGSGKTRLAEYLANELNQKMYSINCSVDVDIEALLGFKTINYKDGVQEIEFVEGPAIQALKTGAVLYIDEINMAKPEVLPILNALLDYRREITNPLTGVSHKAHVDFKVIAAINVGYVGTMPMNEALLNRFNVMFIDYVHGEMLFDLLKSQSVQQDHEVLQKVVQFHEDLMTLAQQRQISNESASIRSLLDFSDLTAHIPYARALNLSLINKLDSEQEQKAIHNAYLLNFDG